MGIRQIFMSLLVLTLLTFASPALAQNAEVVYVEVGRSYLRQGPGVEYQQRNLVSEGTRLEVESSRGGWLQVKTTLGNEGWILERATTATPPPEVIIRELEQRITVLEETNGARNERIRSLADTRQNLELEASQLKAEVLAKEARLDDLESRQTFWWACLGVLVLLLGWGLGFFTGMGRKQLENRHQEQMVQKSRSRMSS